MINCGGCHAWLPQAQKKIFSLKEKRWEPLLNACPSPLQDHIAELHKQLVPFRQELTKQKWEKMKPNKPSLFKKEQSEAESSKACDTPRKNFK